MTSVFVDSINIIVSADDGGGTNDTAATKCKETITHYTFYQLALIPAVLVTLAFTVTKQRRNVLLHIWRGRPGLIYPMDTLTRSSRISYACSFGATAFLVYQIVLSQTYAVNYTAQNRAVKSFVAIGSMFIYGLVFFPVFTSLAIGSVFGYSLGALYVWMLTAVQFFRLFQCEFASREAELITVMRVLPSMLCLVYLSLSIPVRGVRAWRRGHYFGWTENEQDTNTLSDIRASYAGYHVTKLLRKPKIKPPPPETLKGRIVSLLLSLLHRFVYKRQRGFRYPARMISILFIAILVLYTLTYECLAVFPRLCALYRDGVYEYIEYVLGEDAVPGEDPYITDLRNLLYVAWWYLDALRVCCIVSITMAAVFAVFNVLHALSSYRAHLLALYRGDHSQIPPAAQFSNTSHCINSIKYAGFQVGYMIWSFIIQACILFLLCVILATFISLIMNEFTDWIIMLLELLWPVLMTVVLITVTQFLLAKFLFLQERGLYMALDNRHAYFNFTYFMFFYNVFLGLASCVMRILKAMLLGIIFLSRLDNSTLSRRFEFFDPGFRAYVGYMHMEAAHTHPVMIVFCRLMFLGLSDKRERERQRSDSPDTPSSDCLELVVRNNRVHAAGDGENGCCGNGATTTSTKATPDLSEEKRRRRAAARFNWHVTYTLLHNPDIRVMRKGYLQMFRQARLMGVYIPVSDRQADVDFDQLQERMADARQKLNPTKEKKKDEGGDGDEVDLKEVVTAVQKSDVPKAMTEGSPAVLAAQVMTCDLHLARTSPLETTFVRTDTGLTEVKGGVLDRDLPSPSVEPPQVKHESPSALHGDTPARDDSDPLEDERTPASPRSDKYVTTIKV
ncbi:receptor for retinol uptake stra6-like [Babylonia areolata]|uniref:receptor for retinol uptake stra6-like n=1 Tax=Babylonia areolata TaxID=304850 RepID=UPI003FD2EA08